MSPQKRLARESEVEYLIGFAEVVEMVDTLS